MKHYLHRYRAALITAMLFIFFLILFPAYQHKAIDILFFQGKTMVLVIPPIFILLGLLDLWVPREQMMRLMGPGSGIKGGTIAFLLGSFAAGPLYGAFPVTAVLMKKGVSFTNILIFIGAWSTTKIPMLLFESQAFGLRFAMARLAIDIVGIIVIAMAIKTALSEDEITHLYQQAERLD